VIGTAAGRASSIAMVASSPTSASAPTGALPAERYVATNRFRVKDGREAAFEKRWADRKSRLGLLDGFRFFCMMRRVHLGEKTYEDDINYISCTVWENVESFDAWKRGDAFKEAHGGGTIGGIATMLLATAQNTKGKPKAAMWEGLLPVSMPPDASEESSGWREVIADGKTMLDDECFIAMNRFSVNEGMAGAFEQRFAARESTLSTYDGFKGFVLLRRDGKDEDGFTHSTCGPRIEPCSLSLLDSYRTPRPCLFIARSPSRWSVWNNRAAFEAWKSSESRAGKAKEGGAPAATAPSPPSLYARPPVPTFYEGILKLESPKGV